MTNFTPSNLFRSVMGATRGARVRSSAARAQNQVQIAEIICLRPEDEAPVSQLQFERAAARLQLSPAVLHAFADVESGKQGGFVDGRLTILPEPHVFSRLTAHAFDRSHPHLSYPKQTFNKADLPQGWDQHPYQLDMTDRWGLWSMWAQLDFEAACGAISCNAFQIMGYHAKTLGYPSRADFIKLQYKSQSEHLDAFMRFLVHNGIDRLLRANNYQEAVARYNGRGNVKTYLAKFQQRLEHRRPEYA